MRVGSLRPLTITGKSIHWGKRDAQVDLEGADWHGWADDERASCRNSNKGRHRPRNKTERGPRAHRG
jgi:hypothetical protein